LNGEVGEMKAMTISKAARKAGVGVETIRFYERKGLIDQPLKPLDSGFRVYPEEAVQRIRFIRQAQEIGFSLREIDELMSLRADPSADCADVREQAVAKLEEVDHKIAHLEKIRGALEELIAACPGRGALRVCSIMETLVAATEAAGEHQNGDGKENTR
jgi:MerR family transcriptional regulator, copper efflux regulator